MPNNIIRKIGGSDFKLIVLARMKRRGIGDKSPRANPMGSSQSVRCHQTAKRIGVLPILFAGELDGNRAEPLEKPEWFRRFICFSVEKNSEKYLIVPFAGMEININKVYRYK
jgi:hypothetical protein